MRFAHITDIHVEVAPSWTECVNKRLAGEVNLHLLGRHGHFSRAAQEGLVRRVAELAPDVVLCTGDLTAVGTDAEFVASKALLAPLGAYRVIPGNHDVYTRESVGRFARHHGETAWPAVWRHGEVDVVAIDVCHPDWLSRGWCDAAQLTALDAVLASSDAPAWVMLHYPLRNRRGEPYGPAARACRNAAAIEAVIGRHARVRAILHGHEHHGYRTHVGGVLSLNPGASGYAWLPAKGRTAHFCVYEEEGGEITGVERWAWNGVSFELEAGGAFATGG